MTPAKHTPETFPELYCATEDMDRSKVHNERPAIRREQDGKEIAIITLSGYQIGTDPSPLDYAKLFIAAPETARQRDLLLDCMRYLEQKAKDADKILLADDVFYIAHEALAACGGKS